jgi:hypothetical protein
VSAEAGRVPELEAASRGVEVCAELGIVGGQLLAELEELVVEPAFALADVVCPLDALEGGAAVGAGHEAGSKHKSGIGIRRVWLEGFRAAERARFAASDAKS